MISRQSTLVRLFNGISCNNPPINQMSSDEAAIFVKIGRARDASLIRL